MQRLAKKLVCSQLWAVGVRRGGVSHPARVLSSGRWFDRLIPEDDPETKLQKQKERELVLKKMTRSLFAELRAAPGEKTIATAELIHGAHSNGFPSCTAVPLAEDGVPSLVLPDALSRSHATLVTLCFQALGQAQLKKWTEPFAKAFSPLQINGEPAAAAAAWAAPPAMLNILYLEGFFFSALRRVFVSSSRNALSISERPYGAITFQTSDKETDYFCEALGLHNKLMCHVLLVDSRGRVRWRAHAEPAAGELEALLEATQTLLGEAKAAGAWR